MYILIDMDRMVVLGKHPDLYALANIAWLSCPDASIDIIPDLDPECIAKYSDLDLRNLYWNITGVESQPMAPEELIKQVTALTGELPTTRLNPIELENQAAHIPRTGDNPNRHRYRYVPGLNTPKKLAESAVIPSLTIKPGKAAPAAPPAPPPPATVTAAPKSNAPSLPALGGKQSKKQLIWSMADRLWTTEGKPVDKSTVMAIRKRAMDALEDEGVKRTSASSELGKWQKERIR